MTAFLFMAHNHSHQHYHHHLHEYKTRLAVGLSVITMLAELTAGYAIHSVSLIMEGWHMLSHVMVLLLANLAYVYLRSRRRQLDESRQKRVLALAGFASAVSLLIITLWMMIESYRKWVSTEMEVTTVAFAIAVIGLLVNGLSAYLLHQEEETDYNLRAAYLHVLADMLLSFFAIVSLAGAKYLGWMWIDPITGFLGALILLRWTYDLIRDSWNKILELR